MNNVPTIVPLRESERTGPWPVPRTIPFPVPATALHAYLTTLPGTPETACGAAFDDPAAALARCRGEAVERITAWRPDELERAVPGMRVLETGRFSSEGVRARPAGGPRIVVEELLDAGTVRGRWAVDAAAVVLGAGGWFPAGSTGLAAAPDEHEAVQAGAWELLERDLLTRWWRGWEDSVALPAERRGLGLHEDLELRARLLGGWCVAVAARERRSGLVTVGAAAGPQPERAYRKAVLEALVSLGQLRALLQETHPLGIELPAGRRVLALDRHRFTDLAHNLLALADPRLAGRVWQRFVERRPVPAADVRVTGDSTAAREQEPDPVRLLRVRGHRAFRARLGSPESRWAGLRVCRVLSPTTLAPLPYSVEPTALPVPLA